MGGRDVNQHLLMLLMLYVGSLVLLLLVLVKTGLPHMPSPHVERGSQWTPLCKFSYV